MFILLFKNCIVMNKMSTPSDLCSNDKLKYVIDFFKRKHIHQLNHNDRKSLIHCLSNVVTQLNVDEKKRIASLLYQDKNRVQIFNPLKQFRFSKSCSAYRKKKDPKCKDQEGCRWIVGRQPGCVKEETFEEEENKKTEEKVKLKKKAKGFVFDIKRYHTKKLSEGTFGETFLLTDLKREKS